MARFLKIEASQEGTRNTETDIATRWINVYEIEEIIDADPRSKRDEENEIVKDEKGNDVLIARVCLHLHHDAAGGEYGLVTTGVRYFVDGVASDWVPKVERFIMKDRFPQPAVPEQDEAA